uniref:Uncharacterized protein n=1 Tax=Arundo donax TaxID=35708 RepID=A0A0A8ZBD5_ARUDO
MQAWEADAARGRRGERRESTRRPSCGGERRTARACVAIELQRRSSMKPQECGRRQSSI